MVRAFIDDLVDNVSIPGGIIPKTQKIVPNASFLNTKHYKVRIKGKWNNLGKELAPSPTVAIENGAFVWLSNTVSQITYYIYIYIYSDRAGLACIGIISPKNAYNQRSPNQTKASHTHTHTYTHIYIYVRGAYDKFPDFFRMGAFIDSTHIKL